MLHPGFREPINLTVESDNTFVMKVHPWISKESLNAAYRAMWRPWVGDCHPPTNEALDLLEFVLEHTGEAGKRPPSEKLRVYSCRHTCLTTNREGRRFESCRAR